MPEPHDETPPRDPAGGPASSGRERLRAALVRPSRGQAVVAVLLAVLGFAFVVQVNDYRADATYAGLREGQLIEILDGLTGTAQRARREVERLEARRDELQSENTRREAALEEAAQRARTLNIVAGLVPVSGPGLRVTIEETSGRVSVGALLDTIQELRTAGAEAMEFNDRFRLGADSSFENAVGGIELDGRLLEPPYVLEVIGDPHALRAGLSLTSGPIDTLQGEDGATVTVDVPDTVEITSVRELDRPEHAEPADSQ